MKYSAGVLAIVFLILTASTAPSGPSVYPLGTTIYEPDKCWNGFTILSTEEGRLIDMNGNLVHLWKGPLHHPNKVFPGGYLLTSTAAWKQGHQDAIQIQIRDFNDRILWKFDHWQQGKANEGDGMMWLSRQHHQEDPHGSWFHRHARSRIERCLTITKLRHCTR